MIGLLTTGISGLGWLAVIGRSLVPSPPAMTTARTACQRSLQAQEIVSPLPPFDAGRGAQPRGRYPGPRLAGGELARHRVRRPTSRVQFPIVRMPNRTHEPRPHMTSGANREKAAGKRTEGSG